MKMRKQFDQKDCSLYVLKYFIWHFHREDIDINYLKLKASYGSEGINVYSLKEQAKEFNIGIETYNCIFDSLNQLKKDDLPIALLIAKNYLRHFVILKKIKNNKYYIYDPEDEYIHVYSEKELREIFLEIILIFEPSGKIEKNNLNIENKINSLINNKKYTFILLFLACVNLLPTIGVAFYSKIIFDIILPNKSITNLLVVFLLFIWFNIFRFIVILYKNVMINKLTNKIDIELTQKLISKINSLRLTEFKKIEISDYLRRFNYVNVIAEYKANFLFYIVFDLLSFVVSSFIMIYLNYLIFAVVFILMIIISLFNYICRIKSSKLVKPLMHNQLLELESQKNILNNCMNVNKTHLANYLEKKHNILKLQSRQIFSNINNISNFKNFINSLFMGNFNIIIIFISSIFLLKNELSIGTIIMVLTISSFLINPFESISNLFFSKNLYNEAIDNINFMLNINNANNREGNLKIGDINEIYIDKLFFEYENGKAILNIEKFTIDQNIQFIGKNGIGKSTFINVINNNIDDWKGNITINNIDYWNLDIDKFKEEIIVLNSNNILPDIKVFEYITNGDKNKENNFNEVINTTSLANLIAKMNINLNQKIIDNGSNFSTGQRQFLFILRLFIQSYKLIVLDEIFENLDTSIIDELKKIIKNIHQKALFIEISHSKKFIFNSKEINFEEINRI
ncbi:Mbov_0121 family peptidase domain-containing ABC transporter [Mycoplasmopsis meleagridis]|nr:cysteine peptidase family C39 domain-containing protein [Mycoplasmopsis meleagridis]